MEDTITTIEDLAVLIQRTMANKEDVHALDKKVTEGFERVDSRLDRIEHLLLAEQEMESRKRLVLGNAQRLDQKN